MRVLISLSVSLPRACIKARIKMGNFKGNILPLVWEEGRM
ncbi:hypothetical protein HMPREF9997_01971 [Corynebacterium durum F0235]|uniref:Uncharacterized protein n=1 Tax=Corynebacterium durum F0235 TaxID=1035195 RepID=L1MD67_9CORY|nr:hypothetical protein HMPREF9997_01971 [Corynebacterium durum F0235]